MNSLCVYFQIKSFSKNFATVNTIEFFYWETNLCYLINLALLLFQVNMDFCYPLIKLYLQDRRYGHFMCLRLSRSSESFVNVSTVLLFNLIWWLCPVRNQTLTLTFLNNDCFNGRNVYKTN